MASEKKKIETAEAAVLDPNERVEVFIPRGEKNGDPNLYVSVNDYTALLPRGQKSMVPRFVADEIRRADEAKNDFFTYAETRELSE